MEDLGDLVRGSPPHLLLGFEEVRGQGIQGTDGTSHPFRGHMEIALRGLQGAVSQEDLDHPQIRTGLK